MTVTLHSTEKIVTLNGVQCRVWEGRTAKGVPCHAYIPRIAVAEELDSTEFEHDLMECAKPSAEVAAIPARLTL